MKALLENLSKICIRLPIMVQVIRENGEEFEVIPQLASAASGIIAKMYEKLGRPEDPFTDAGSKMMEIIIAVWEDLYPTDAREWFLMRKEHVNAELSLQDQVLNRTGRSLASYPYPIYMMMKKVFPKFDSAKKENCIKIIEKWPMFKFVNEV